MVSSESSDIYKSAEQLPIMPLLDLNKVVWKRFKEQKSYIGKLWSCKEWYSKYYNINSISKISVHFSQSEFNILPVAIFKKD